MPQILRGRDINWQFDTPITVAAEKALTGAFQIDGADAHRGRAGRSDRGDERRHQPGDARRDRRAAARRRSGAPPPELPNSPTPQPASAEPET
jgi:hypothetical protein